MRKYVLPVVVLSVFSLLAAASPRSQAGSDARPTLGDLRSQSGTVRLEVSCLPQVRADFQTALALTHSFFYDEARRRFEEIARRDPECAMAWWGVAMTWYHPLWAAPTPEELDAGAAAVAKARALGGKTELERGLIDVVEAFFRSDDGPVSGDVAISCHGPRAHGARAEAFSNALDTLRRKFPDNLEVTVFYTLSLLATAPPTDRTYQRQLMATAILEPLFEKNPDHPGIPHYIIHAYDYPTLASRGLGAARQYDDIAPWVPHALHMPSHIYTRLGMWQDSIEANRASADAGKQYTERVSPGAVGHDELHALDYLVFGYLQTAQDRKALELVDYVRGMKRFSSPNFASAYAIGAIPARAALERQRWEEAAQLSVLHPDVVGAFPFAVAHTEFARAIGAARSGKPEVARQAIGRLAQLRDALDRPKYAWWIDQIEIQRAAASAWLARAEGDVDVAVKRMFEAAELEDRAGTHPVTPGQILPVQEQLGDLLMLLDRPAEALTAYEKSLAAFPRRLNGHLGAARAAEQAQRADLARRHYEQVVQLGAAGDGRRAEIQRAREFVARPQATAD